MAEVFDKKHTNIAEIGLAFLPGKRYTEDNTNKGGTGVFTKDFTWGVATAAYQIEGAAKEDGRGLSVWDVFAEDGHCLGYTAEVACDHYHRFEEDIALMKELGVDAYRFSIAWPRIFPNGFGEVNQKGIDFYNRLIDCLLENGITPYVTLYHWDLPYELEKRGNWSNPDSPSWFLAYAETVFRAFGDRVKHFITFNEPQCFIGTGYSNGIHAPGSKCSQRDLILKAHHVMLAHGLAVKAFRKLVPDGKIGYAPNASAAMPASDSAADIEAARRYYFDAPLDTWMFSVAWWSDPVMLGTYPEDTEAFRAYGKFLPETYKEDLKIISEPIDFYCQNIYRGYLIRATENGCERLPAPIETPYNSLMWSITPPCLYWGPRYLYERYGKPVLISENGITCHDRISADGKVHDQSRIDFMQQHFEQVEKAIADGVDVIGYMYWSFMDNFEWTHGYAPRFGLVYVDYNDLKRTPKESFYWYRDFIKNSHQA